MNWNWQHPDWPNWRIDQAQLADLERQFLLGSGRLMGAKPHGERLRSASRRDPNPHRRPQALYRSWHTYH